MKTGVDDIEGQRPRLTHFSATAARNRFQTQLQGELTTQHQDTEKSSRPERRRPRWHQHLTAMTLRQLRQTKRIKILCQFLCFMNSNACSKE